MLWKLQDKKFKNIDCYGFV